MTISLRRMLLTAGGAVLLGLAAIGLVQAASTADAKPATPFAAAPATTTSATPTTAATGATSDEALTSELDAILAADQTTAAQPAAGARGDAAVGALRKLRAGRHLVHATVVLDLPKKGLTTIQLDHGKISAVGATSLTVAEAGGSSVTVTLGADTRVRKNAAKAAIGDLKTGDEVVVMSKVEAGGTVAYLVIVPKA